MRIQVKKFGEILTSRPAGHDAALAIKAYFKPGPEEPIELDFEGVLAVGPSWMDEVLTLLWEAYGRERVRCLPSDNASVVSSLKMIEER